MIDRIEVITSFEVPTEINKKEFLQNKFKTFMTSELVELVSHNSIGYNYRDLPEMIKLAYRLGNSTISQESVKKALRIYRPTQLYGFSVYNGINTTLADVIGKKEAVKVVKRLVHIYKNEHLSQQLGLKRANLLLFQGQAGTGKTFMAKALAGELGFPLISAKAGGFDMGVFETIQRITKLAKRYRNCVLFIDEAEKMFGNPRFEEDNMVLGELQRCLEGADGKEIRSVVILAVNDLDRFGEGIQDRFNIVKFNLPSYEDRLEFCKSKVEDAKEKLKQEIDYNYLAQKTKDMSFREIDRFWNDLMFHYLENKKEINNETIAYLMKSSGKVETDSMFG
jgi:AAA+ superfamily predicted ATPase